MPLFYQLDKMKLAKLRKDVKEIFYSGLKAADPSMAVKKKVSMEGNILKVGDFQYDLSDFSSVFVVGAGKAAASMALGVEEVIGDRITGGLINVKYGHGVPLKKVRIKEAGHPIPDEAGLRGTAEIVELLSMAGEKDLVICLLSGGGSSLLVFPWEGITLKEKQEMTRLMLECGANILEINAIRKHISRVKGGRLAKLAYPAPLITLLVSDIIGDRIDFIASGPTVSDSTTYEECLNILEKYGLLGRIPMSIVEHLRAGVQGKVEETPKEGDKILGKARNLVILNNMEALKAVEDKARALGYNTLILSSYVEGEAREVAKVYCSIAREIWKSGHPIVSPACIISGGETTVTVKGKGLGGRNQEFVLAASMGISGMENVVILSAGSDGTDGPTDAAGAVADGLTMRKALEMGMNPWKYLQGNDSYNFFQRLGDLIITGPTQTNVMDIMLVLVG